MTNDQQWQITKQQKRQTANENKAKYPQTTIIDKWQTMTNVKHPKTSIIDKWQTGTNDKQQQTINNEI